MKIGITQIMGSLLFISSLVNASATSGPTQSKQPNIKIYAQQMDYDQSKSICIATGNAIAEKLNDSKVKILKADKITAHFTKKDASGSLKVSLLEAEGKVIILSGPDLIIQGENAKYTPESEIAEIFQNVKITNGENQLDGSYGKFNMKTGHYSLKEEGKRVQALILTKSSDQENKVYVKK
ncbi:MAG: hypothetical protein FJX03_00470 [Alphaproteobacteria bacterium]|nr:hypothetical protein [Alphaproteobacteria bacterium]